MANVLKTEKKVAVISMLAEGASIRSIERITGVNRNTIMSLGLRVGAACKKIMDEKLRGLTCAEIQADEIWGFIGAKQKNAKKKMRGWYFRISNRLNEQRRIRGRTAYVRNGRTILRPIYRHHIASTPSS